MKDLRIVFFGTPDFAVASLKALVDGGFKVVAAVTAIDKPSGRGHKMQSPPVKLFVDEHNIPCLQPPNLKSESFVQELQGFEADLQIVVAFRMLPEIVWNMPPLGTYNVHASLLPDYRGAAPINWAIINGEKLTGVTTFKLQHQIDTGNILFQQPVEIKESDNAGTLHDKLMEAGAELLIRSVTAIASGPVALKPQQDGGSKEAPKIFKDICQIDWNLPASKVRDFIRGMSPFPTSYAKVVLEDGSKENWKIYDSSLTQHCCTSPGLLKILDGKLLISCIDHWLEINELQSPGKKRMKAEEFLRGLRFDLDTIKLE